VALPAAASRTTSSPVSVIGPAVARTSVSRTSLPAIVTGTDAACALASGTSLVSSASENGVPPRLMVGGVTRPSSALIVLATRRSA
jgi:hypothetical protein